MKIERARKVIAILRVIAPEYGGMAEDALKTWVELAEPHVSEEKFGGMYHQALACLAAHKMALNMPVQDGAGGAPVSVKGMMNVASYTEGSTSISYNSQASAGATGGGSGDAEYSLTAYGLQFREIRDKCIVPIAAAGMKRT